MQNLTIGFAGLSHLGTCSSIAAHLQGNKIVAFDSDNKVINERMNGRFDSAEPGIDSFLSKIKNKSVFFVNMLRKINYRCKKP